jgi:hypothetical protein
MLTAREKSGKSWLAQQMITALDTGGMFCGALRAEEVESLYFSLESREEDLQERLLVQHNTGFNHAIAAFDRIEYNALDNFLSENKACKVVLIDTMTIFCPPNKGGYNDIVPVLVPLKKIADTHKAAIMLVHHQRKNQAEAEDALNASLGSVGITGSMDTILTLSHKHNAPTGKLSVTGRVLRERQFELAWNESDCMFTITGDGPAVPALSETQQKLLDLLNNEQREVSTGELAAALGKDAGQMSRTLKGLADMGHIKATGRGKWACNDFDNLTSLKEKSKSQNENSPESLSPSHPVDMTLAPEDIPEF